MYTLVFWSKKRGWDEEDILDDKTEERVISHIEQVNDSFVDHELEEPVYFCEATGWKATSMLPI